MNMEELLAQESLPDIQERTTVKGKVIQVNRDEAYVDIGYKQEIAIPKRELAYPAPESAEDVVKVGDVIDVYVVSLGGDNGGILSKVKADRMVAWTEMEKKKEDGPGSHHAGCQGRPRCLRRRSARLHPGISDGTPLRQGSLHLCRPDGRG